MIPIRVDHPRLWLTPASLTNLKTRAAAKEDRWLGVLQAANVSPADWNTGIINYALAWQITGDPAFAQRAWDLMTQSMAAGTAQVTSPLIVPMGHSAIGKPTGTNEVSGDSGYQCRNYFPAACVVLDWLDTWLQPAQKTQLITDIQTCADWVWPETNPARVHQWGVDADMAGNNYHQAFLFTWLAGLVLPPGPKQQGYLDNARRRYDTEVVPYLLSLAKGGVWQEMLGYGTGSTGFLLWNLLAHASATGEDLLANNPWFTDAVSAMIHFTTPSLTEKAPFGDLAAGPLNDYSRRVMLGMSGHDPRAAFWLNSIQPNRNQQLLTRWEDCLFWTPPVPGPNPAPVTGFYSAPGTGLVSIRTNWTASATQLLAVAGPTTESHQDRAQGSVMLWRNGWQLATAKLGSHSGLDQEAWDYCCLTVDGQKQAWTQNGCQWLIQEDTPAYTFLVADLAAAYVGQLSSYRREALFIKAGSYLLLKDTYVPVKATSLVTAHHSVPVLPNTVLGFSFQAGSLYSLPLLPAASRFQSSKVQNDPLDTPSYRLDLAGDSSGVILAAFEARDTGAPVSLGPGYLAQQAEGIFTRDGFAGWLLGPPPWSMSAPVTGVHLLLGLKPNTSYSVPGGTVVSSAGGVLRFPAPAGVLAIREGGGLPPPPPPPPPPVDRKYLLTIPAVGEPTLTKLG